MWAKIDNFWKIIRQRAYAIPVDRITDSTERFFTLLGRILPSKTSALDQAVAVSAGFDSLWFLQVISALSVAE